MNDLIKLIEESNIRLLSKEEAVKLLQINILSEEYYKLINKSNMLSHTEYNGRGYVFSQIGLNASPCSANCKFCSLAASNYSVQGEFCKDSKDITELKQQVSNLITDGTNDIFLMTTADYPIDEFIRVGYEIKKNITDKDVRLVANIGDFSLEEALKLKQAGFTGAYHIVRLREGIDTDISPETRIETINNIKTAGLELYYCIEPIGPEHSYDEIASEMIRARELNVEAMAVMRRTSVPGTKLYDKGMISILELIKIAAVTRIVSRPTRSMNVHEVTPMSMLAGVNQLYAEAGANPRDNIKDTSTSRGYSVKEVNQLLVDAGYILK